MMMTYLVSNEAMLYLESHTVSVLLKIDINFFIWKLDLHEHLILFFRTGII